MKTELNPNLNPPLRDALSALLQEAEAMNVELRHIGKSRPDGGAHPDCPMQQAREALGFAEDMAS